jgi:hypothetical protein
MSCRILLERLRLFNWRKKVKYEEQEKQKLRDIKLNLLADNYDEIVYIVKNFKNMEDEVYRLKNELRKKTFEKDFVSTKTLYQNIELPTPLIPSVQLFTNLHKVPQTIMPYMTINEDNTLIIKLNTGYRDYSITIDLNEEPYYAGLLYKDEKHKERFDQIEIDIPDDCSITTIGSDNLSNLSSLKDWIDIKDHDVESETGIEGDVDMSKSVILPQQSS